VTKETYRDRGKAEIKRREGKGREGKGREGKGREEKRDNR